MAQATLGIKVLWQTAGVGGIEPTWDATAKQFVGITGIPSFEAAPETIDVTPIDETEMMQYVQGLQDIGQLEFPALYSNELSDEVDACIADPKPWVTVVYPAPANKRVSFPVSMQALRPGEASVNSALTCTLYMTPKAAITLSDVTV